MLVEMGFHTKPETQTKYKYIFILHACARQMGWMRVLDKCSLGRNLKVCEID